MDFEESGYLFACSSGTCRTASTLTRQSLTGHPLFVVVLSGEEMAAKLDCFSQDSSKNVNK